MFNSILVPLDGSTFTEHALPLAMSLAKRAKAKLLLAHIHSPLKAVYLEGASFLDDSVEEDIKNQQRAYLNMVAERVKKVVAIPVETILEEGEISPTIATVASAQGVDLVVMTTHGRSALGRFWLGSVADELIRQLPMPQLIVRPHEDTPDLTKDISFKHILISLDGTEMAEHIIEPAAAIGELMESDFTLVRIIKPVMTLDYPVEISTTSQAVKEILVRVDEIQGKLMNEAESYLQGVADRLKVRGFKVETKVDIEQQPAVAILNDAKPSEIDLIAIETHGRYGLSRLFLGSITDKIIRGAEVPVLVHKQSEN